MRHRVLLASAVYGGLAFASPAGAQSLQDDVWIEISGYYPAIDTSVRVDTVDGTIGTEIDLEDDLDFEDREILPAIFAGVRVGSGFSIGVEYYSLGRSNSATLERDIVFDGVTYPVSGEVSAEFNTDIYRVVLGFAFVRGDNFEIGGALGLHATNIEAVIEGQGQVAGGTAQIERRSRDLLAPLPTLGLFGTFEIAPRLTLGARVDYLSLKIDEYDGELVNAQASIVYRLFDNVGVGVAYRYVDYTVGVTGERLVGRFEYQFHGPSIFLQIGF